MAVAASTGLRLRELAAIALACASVFVWPVYFGDMFPLSELRDWLVFFEVPSIRTRTFNNLIFRETTYSRDLPLLYAALIGGTCGTHISCVNLLAALPLCFAAVVFFLLARELSGSLVISSIAVAMWTLSTPYLDTMAWQATLLDRVGILFCLLSLLAAWKLPIARTTLVAVVHAALFLLLTIATMNSKEAYWFTPIGVVFAYFGRAWIERDSRNREFASFSLTLAAIVAMPMVIYVCWFILRYQNAIPFAENWNTHVAGGSVFRNFRTNIRNVFGGAGTGLLIVLLATSSLTAL
jgi:hypothetical protein